MPHFPKMPIPRPPPSPPNLQLSLQDLDDNPCSQAPTCTPNELMINSAAKELGSPPTPVRTTVKKRRTSVHTVMGASSVFDNAVDPCDDRRRGGRNVHRAAVGGDDEGRLLPLACSQQRVDLPDMSQDTLALFPAIVQEHHRMTHPVEFSESQQSFDAPLQQQRGVVSGRKRGNENARGQLAKVSLINTLSNVPSMDNPYLTSAGGGGGGGGGGGAGAGAQIVNTPHDKSQYAIRKVANASQSFQNMQPAIQECWLESACAKAAKAKKKQEKMNRLKMMLVASADRRRFRLDFETVQTAGKGAFSEVLQVRHRLDGCTYAIKRNNHALLSDMARLDSLQEVFALAALQGHPNILRYNDAWFEERGKTLMLQTEYLPGGSLSSNYVENSKAMSGQELFALAEDISSALAFMHEKGIAHLDVKPDNIFRCNRGSGRDSFIIGDFGLACHYDGTDARSTEGDSRYLCPEAFSSNENAEAVRAPYDLRRGDMFSLGATIYELALGTALAKSGPDWQQLRTDPKRLGRQVANKTGSPELGSITRRCLEPDPLRRASAQEIVRRCKAHDTPQKSQYVEKLRQQRDEAQRQCRRYDKATCALLKNGEMNRQLYRDGCLKRSRLSSNSPP